jgi:hypothetical protein
VRSPRNVRSNAAGLRGSVLLFRNWRDCGKRSQIALRLDVENLRTLYRHMISLIEVTFMKMGVRDKHKFDNRDSKRKSDVMTPSLP